MNGFDENDAFEAAARPVPLSQRAMAARPTPYLDDLNPAQRAAVEALDGPVLMLAGAGTGKTKALTSRIVHLLNTARARPNEILAVTFTNKAAREMKLRVAKLMGGSDAGLAWMGTFHSISVKILRRHAELAGLKSNFTILDTDDQLRLLKQVLEAENIDRKRWTERWFLHHIESYKNRAWQPETVPSSEDHEVWLVPNSAPRESILGGAGSKRTVVQVYRAYQSRLRELNALDFGDILNHCVTIFQAHPDILQQYQRWFKYILVDEYQDTNVAQYLWLRLLAQSHKNICCVGDDDQSIYGWRGAEVGNILRFEKDFPGAEVVRLEQNYRSTPHILAAASSVIAGNAGRLGKTLWTEAETGEKVRLIGHWDGEEEARWIGDELISLNNGESSIARRRHNVRSVTVAQEAERIAKNGKRSTDPESDIYNLNLQRANVLGSAGLDNIPVPKSFSLDDMVILVRASHQMRAFEDRFLTIGLPYRVIGGPRFYERLEIRDAMAYFRLAVSPDDDLAFERVINTPKRGLGDKAQQNIQRVARAGGMRLLDGARELLADGGIGGKGAGQLRAFCDGMARWHQATLKPDYNHVELAETILEESGYTAMWQNDKSPEAAGRLENLKELVKALDNFENLQGFLEHVSLIMENETEEQGAKVSIMTLHAAKGLEFPAVFLPGWEDGLFPSQRSMDESGTKGLEEERRLAYVGITRAEEICTISFASNRRVYGQWQSQLPSRFIDELPIDHVDILTPPGLYGGGYGAAAPAPKIEERAAKADVYNSPGWRRMQDRSAQRMSQPREAKGTTIDLAAVSSFTKGDRVFHQKFGYGTIDAIEGDKLDVAFDKAGSKKVVAGYVVAADQAHDLPF